jgi:hypothetical protein
MAFIILQSILVALGVIFIVFTNQVVIAIRWLDKTIWNEKRRRQFPGHGGNVNPTPFGVRLLGASWIVSAVVIWFTVKG